MSLIALSCNWGNSMIALAILELFIVCILDAPITFPFFLGYSKI
jgi:hypothetical protein